jgi:hypothetical protein
MKNANEYVDEIGKLFDNDMYGFRSEVYCIVLDIRAEALKDAADRAVVYVNTTHWKDIEYDRDNYDIDIDDLRAAILAGEVKE